ncbi:MAG: amidohydrolase [Chloroflexi bacterium]|nr:amidohydrolase [Chloroflexota bacterium]
MDDSNPFDLVIRQGHVLTLDPKSTCYPLADVGVRDGAISAIGPDLSGRGRVEINANGNAVLPGLVNCHMHETLLRGFCEDLPLMRWLEEICFPIDKSLQPKHQRAAAYMNQLEMIRGGITTFLDIYRYPAQAAAVALESGLRAIFSPQIIENPPGAGESLESNLAFVQEWKDRVPGRIFTWFGPHAPYSNSAETYQQISRLAREYQVGIHTHLAETLDEIKMFQSKTGKTPVAYLADLGLLSDRLVVAHAVHLSGEDIHLLAEHDVSVAHNPSSNMKLASGVAPIPDLLAAGVRVGLGTDSNLSNNNLDMFEEMRLAAMLQKLARRDAEAMPCDKVLRMATCEAAACLGLGEQIGSLAVGKRADIIIVNLHAPHMWPILAGPASNVIEQLVYSASAGDVLTTIVDGKILMRDRQVLTLDEVAIEPLVHDAAHDLARCSGLDRTPRQSERG